jgi:hypothetical protein
MSSIGQKFGRPIAASRRFYAGHRHLEEITREEIKDVKPSVPGPLAPAFAWERKNNG